MKCLHQQLIRSAQIDNAESLPSYNPPFRIQKQPVPTTSLELSGAILTGVNQSNPTDTLGRNPMICILLTREKLHCYFLINLQLCAYSMPLQSISWSYWFCNCNSNRRASVTSEKGRHMFLNMQWTCAWEQWPISASTI